MKSFTVQAIFFPFFSFSPCQERFFLALDAEQKESKYAI